MALVGVFCPAKGGQALGNSVTRTLGFASTKSGVLFYLFKNDKKTVIIVGDAYMRPLQPDKTKMLLSKIVHGFKAAVTREINQIQDNIFFQWQRSFHDHIIRNEKSYLTIKEYICNNPMK